MSTGLTKADIEAAVDAARGRKGPQIELRDLRFRAGERSAKWSLMVGLHTGERSRITLGSWPALSINDARAAAREVRRQVEEGRNPNEERRNLARGAAPRPVPLGPCPYAAPILALGPAPSPPRRSAPDRKSVVK